MDAAPGQGRASGEAGGGGGSSGKGIIQPPSCRVPGPAESVGGCIRQVTAEHDPEVAGVGAGEVHVTEADGLELGPGIGVMLRSKTIHLAHEPLEPVGRDFGQKPCQRAEMVGGGAVGDPGTAGDIPEGSPPPPPARRR